MGRLIRKIRTVLDIPDELEQKLNECLKKRNWLAHTYFWERVEKMLSHDGRNELIEELLQVRNLFSETDLLLSSFLKPLQTKNGFPPEVLEAAYSEYINGIET
jgi:hypothetical protein